jgi:hypothetical protein
MALERRNVPKIGLIFKLKGLKSNVHAQCELWCQVPGRSGGYGEAFHFSVLLTYRGRAPY